MFSAQSLALEHLGRSRSFRLSSHFAKIWLKQSPSASPREQCGALFTSTSTPTIVSSSQSDILASSSGADFLGRPPEKRPGGMDGEAAPFPPNKGARSRNTLHKCIRTPVKRGAGTRARKPSVVGGGGATRCGSEAGEDRGAAPGDEEEEDAEADGGVGDVEDAGAEGADADADEVDDGAVVDQAVDEVAEAAAGEEGEGYELDG